MVVILVFIFGLIFGSFISALTWRIPRNMNFVNARSECDKCNSKISWYDNIPLLSYLLLGGKCRGCGKKISIRYPIIEFFTAVISVLIYLVFMNCSQVGAGLVCNFTGTLSYWTLPYLLLIVVLMVSIFVTDLELQIIPDEFVFFLFGLHSIILILFFGNELYQSMFGGFLMSVVFLTLNFITKGKGMGLGDAKLALVIGSILGLKYAALWILLSFVIGATVGLVLVFLKKSKFGVRIAFGPFMVFSFFLVLFWGRSLMQIFFPYM